MSACCGHAGHFGPRTCKVHAQTGRYRAAAPRPMQTFDPGGVSRSHRHDRSGAPRRWVHCSPPGLIDRQKTAAWAADHPEARAIQSALWGDIAALAEAVATGAFRTDLFVNHIRRATAAAIIATVEAGDPDRITSVYDRLVVSGIRDVDARDAVILPGTFAATGGTVSGLPLWLDWLAEERLRWRCSERLVALVNTLPYRGGPARVATVLGIGEEA